MSRAIEAAALFAVGCIAGGAVVYSTRRTDPVPPPPQPSTAPPPALSKQRDILVAEPVRQEFERLLRYGNPGPIHDIGNRLAFASCYDRRMRNPAWVVEEITKEQLQKKIGDRKNSLFLEDPAIPAKFRAKLSDYFRSGYDRGHQVPAADAKLSQTAMNETFYLTNMCPQVGDGFNRDYWAHFEDFCRRLTQKYANVQIYTGPLYLPRQYPDGKWRVSYEVIGSPPSVAVPTHFFKVIVAEPKDNSSTVAVGAFVLPNQEIDNSTALTTFLTPIEAVERYYLQFPLSQYFFYPSGRRRLIFRASGLEFLTELPPGRRTELCKEVECGILVREFADRSQQKRLPSPAPGNLPGSPRR